MTSYRDYQAVPAHLLDHDATVPVQVRVPARFRAAAEPELQALLDGLVGVEASYQGRMVGLFRSTWQAQIQLAGPAGLLQEAARVIQRWHTDLRIAAAGR